MKFKAVCFLLCVCFCFYSVSLSSSAVDDFEPVFPLPEDLIDLGFELDEDGNYSYYGNDDPFDFGFTPFISNEKNYPGFDPSKVPWSTFPQYIKDIIYMDLDDLSVEFGQPFKVPFVSCVVVSSATVQIFVGVNVGWGQINNPTLNFTIWSFLDRPAISDFACLYRLAYNYVNDPYAKNAQWTEYKPAAFGNNGNLNWMLGYYWTDASVVDVYCYGANGIEYPTRATSVSVPYNTGSTGAVGFYTAKNGFQSGRFLYGQDKAYPYAYFEYFSPPSPESINQQLQQENNENQKGIWETLKSIPDMIGEKIKGLFVPSDGFFNTYTSEFQEYFKERFGLLYEIPELFVSLLTKIMTFNPAEDEYSITFPEVVLPVLEDGKWRDVVLIEAQEYSFDIINEPPFNLLYDMYIAFIWLVYILLLVNLIRYKANSVFKGG